MRSPLELVFGNPLQDLSCIRHLLIELWQQDLCDSHTSLLTRRITRCRPGTDIEIIPPKFYPSEATSGTLWSTRRFRIIEFWTASAVAAWASSTRPKTRDSAAP